MFNSQSFTFHRCNFTKVKSILTQAHNIDGNIVPIVIVKKKFNVYVKIYQFTILYLMLFILYCICIECDDRCIRVWVWLKAFKSNTELSCFVCIFLVARLSNVTTLLNATNHFIENGFCWLMMYTLTHT